MEQPSADGDTIVIREEKLDFDRPLPDARITWKGKAGEVLMMPAGWDPRREKPGDEITLASTLDLLKSMHVSEIYWSEKSLSLLVKADQGHPKTAQLSPALDLVLAAAAERGMTVGLFLNWNGKGIDFTSKAYRQSMHNMIDALAEKKQKYPNLTSLWWDEIWAGMARSDFAGKLDSFRDFCKREFGEAYPGTAMPPKADPADKWWRRHVVYRYCIYETFARDLADYAKSKGIISIPFLVNPHRYRNAWQWGHDRYRQTKIGDFTYAPTYYMAPLNVENSIMHLQADFADFSIAQALRGVPVEHWCVFSVLENPRLQARMKEVLGLADEWFGALEQEEVAVLTYPVSLHGRFLNAEFVYADNDEIIQEVLATRFPTRMIDVRDVRLFRQFKVLVLPKYAGYSIPEFALKGLMEFAQNGGTIIALDTEFAVGRRDLTDPKPATPDVAGLRLAEERPLSGAVRFSSPAGMELPLQPESRAAVPQATDPAARPVAFVNGRPVGFERTVGKGRVIALYCDTARQLLADRARWGDALTQWIMKYHAPGITAEGNVSIRGVIRKDDRLLVSLSTGKGVHIAISVKPTDVPVVTGAEATTKGLLKVDVRKLGLPLDTAQVFDLAYSRETPSPTGGTWTAAQLLAGIPVEVQADREFGLLAIEKPGISHARSTLEADLQHAAKSEEEGFRRAKENPPIAFNPLSARVRVSDGAARSDAPWSAEAACRLPLTIVSDAPASNEIIAVPCANLAARLRGFTVSPASFRLYRLGGDAPKEVPCQVVSWEDRARGVVRDAPQSLSATDEMFIVTDLSAGENRFLLYAGVSATPDAAPAAATRSTDKTGLTVDNGLARGTFAPTGRFTLQASAFDKPSISGIAFGCRFALAFWPAPTPYTIVANGPSTTIVRREATGALTGTQRKGNMVAVFQFFRNSPLVYVVLSADATVRSQNYHWPSLRLCPEGQSLAAACRVLTDEGWIKPSFASRKMRHDCKTAFSFQQAPSPQDFSLITAASTFATNPRWLIEAGGLAWLEPTKFHSQFIPAINPSVEYFYRQGPATETELDALVNHLQSPVEVRLGDVEHRRLR